MSYKIHEKNKVRKRRKGKRRREGERRGGKVGGAHMDLDHT